MVSATSSDRIVVVSGLPRSGTSMMMKMLEAAGLPLVTDGERTADEDNPKGYFELERVKQLDKAAGDWIDDCKGKAVKVISKLLMHLPLEHEYDVLFMRRNLDEILASQKKMLARRGEAEGADDAAMKSMFYEHLEEVMTWLDEHPRFRVCYVSYNRMMSEPDPQIARVAHLLGDRFDAAAARSAIDTSLYRNRS